MQANDVISGGERFALEAKGFAQNPFDCASGHGERCKALADDEAKASLGRRCGAQRKKRPPCQAAPLQRRGKLSRTAQSRGAGKRRARVQQRDCRALAETWFREPRSVLDGQALAALGAARIDDGAATTGFHANAKAVGALAASDGRLVGTFHDDSGR